MNNLVLKYIKEVFIMSAENYIIIIGHFIFKQQNKMVTTMGQVIIASEKRSNNMPAA